MKKRFFGLFVCILLIFSSGFAYSTSATTKEEPRLGIWITVFSSENILFSTDNIDKLIKICERTGIKDIYIQIYRSNKAYYNSSIIEKTPYNDIIAKAGTDTVKYLIEKTRGKDIKVHAWLNILSIARNYDAGIIKKFGKDIITVDQYGRDSFKSQEKKGLDKYYIREKQLFLEPGDYRVREYFSGVIKEITENYPGLDGLHFDYIRYPSAVPFIPGSRFTSHGISYGYGRLNLKAFRESTGIDIKTMPYSRKNFSIWDQWKRDRVTKLVAFMSAEAKKISPGIEISCTVVSSIERAYTTTFQDWTTWLEKGYADYIVVMNYSDDIKLVEMNARSFLAQAAAGKIYVGVGAYLIKDSTEEIEKQINMIESLAPGGIVVFSYDDIVNNSELLDYLSKKFIATEEEGPVEYMTGDYTTE